MYKTGPCSHRMSWMNHTLIRNRTEPCGFNTISSCCDALQDYRVQVLMVLSRTNDVCPTLMINRLLGLENRLYLFVVLVYPKVLLYEINRKTFHAMFSTVDVKRFNTKFILLHIFG